MKYITFTKKRFPKGTNGTSKLQFTQTALLRAVVAAGREPKPGNRTDATKADIAMRINALKSAVDMTKSVLVPTPEFLISPTTDKGHKSFYIGNALCAHAALMVLRIP